MNNIKGIDISHHQGKKIKHTLVYKSGMSFCICKASEGRTYEDPTFERNIQEIRKVLNSGKVYYPGAYHFARPDTDGGNYEDGQKEGENFCNIVERVCGDILHDFMPPALDFEKYSESDIKENIPWIEGWIEVVERRLGRTPMIYTGANIWKYEVGNSDKFINYPLWQVFYSKDAEIPAKTPWPNWALWQYSGGGSFQYHPEVPGVGIADINRWSGTLKDLKIFASAKKRCSNP